MTDEEKDAPIYPRPLKYMESAKANLWHQLDKSSGTLLMHMLETIHVSFIDPLVEQIDDQRAEIKELQRALFRTNLILFIIALGSLGITIWRWI